MSIFIVDTYVVKPEKQEEFTSFIQRFLKYRKENPKKFKEWKSWKIFRQGFGDISGAYVEMMEFENMADAEEWGTRMRKDEVMMKIREAFMLLIDPTTHSMKLWHTIM